MTAIITKECEEVLGQKAHGTAISGTSNIFRKVCNYWGGASDRIILLRYWCMVSMCTCICMLAMCQVMNIHLQIYP